MGFTALKESFLPFLGSVLPQYVVLCVYAGSANFQIRSPNFNKLGNKSSLSGAY